VSLTDDVQAVLFRNARELLMNVAKHAKAGKVSVRMETSGDMLRILVEDDGVGFVPETVTDRPNHEGAFGLFSIYESMADVGGSVKIVSTPGKGSRVILIAPLEEGKEVTSDQWPVGSDG
jgi:signal transduction histidine kinase